VVIGFAWAGCGIPLAAPALSPDYKASDFRRVSTRVSVPGRILGPGRIARREQLMTRADVEPDHAERALERLIPGIRGVHYRACYWDEKRRASEAVAARLDLILNPRIEW
jgi:hypothetical protein